MDGLAIAVVRIGDDVFAIGDRCTHQNVSLSEGEVYEHDLLLECWKHGSQFSLVTGEPLQLPALKPTPVYPAEVHAGEVLSHCHDPAARPADGPRFRSVLVAPRSGHAGAVGYL